MNCWHETKILPAPFQASFAHNRIPSNEIDGDDPLYELGKLMKKMNTDLSPQAYVEIDNKEPIAATSNLSKDSMELCIQVLEENGVNPTESDNESEKEHSPDEEEKKINFDDALHCIDSLIYFFERLSNNHEKSANLLMRVKSDLVTSAPNAASIQTTVDNFFH